MKSALGRLSSQPDGFAERWPDEPRVHHGDPAEAARLLSVGDLDRVIADQGLPASSVTMAKDNVMARPGSLTAPELAAFPGTAGAVDARRVGERLRSGHTLLVMGLHRTWRPLSEFCRLLTAELGHPLYAHAFLTPPGNQGFAHHWDTEAVFILQTTGHKTWELHEPVLADPLPRHRWGRTPVPPKERERFEKGEPFLRVRLAPGDALWIPRGWVHNGYAEDDTSLHISLGILQLTRHWVIERLLDLAAGDPRFRAALPPALNERGIDEAAAEAARCFAAWLSDLDLDRAAPALRAEQLRAQGGPRRASVTAAVRAPGEEGAVAAVPGAVLATGKGDGGLVLHLGDHDVQVPDAFAGTVEALLGGARLEPGELPAPLVGELLREGVVAPAG
ncbi:cupin domain-containing protein [Actinomadura sp. NEAU-AAG7]|uniref:cupin domain-containing protein n=1 Tax=Actinomadura sp. NEAU-AAG7 TaxID=2839640 RepID=UPI001BE41594|nr:cupin domain-containing protein [Actinomadura sp. NEAU-AAG7]MBT2207833.1 hypothetical protein [Actinomadura sp. NEAU-AAG7]